MTDYMMLMIVCAILMSGYLTLMSSYTMLMTGYSILMTDYSILITGYSILITSQSSLLPGYSHNVSGWFFLFWYCTKHWQKQSFPREERLYFSVIYTYNNDCPLEYRAFMW